VIYSTASTPMGDWTGRDLHGDDRDRVSGPRRRSIDDGFEERVGSLEELEVSPSSCAGRHGP
jgi:hypothetical protein